MGYIVTLVGYTPSPRFPPLLTPWTQAAIEESASSTGPWMQIDEFMLTGPDADPTQPATRNFSTPNGTQPEGLWYRVIFRDGGTLGTGNSQVSSPTYNSSIPDVVPSTAEIRAEWSQVQWAEWGYSAPTVGQPDPLEILRTEAVAEMSRWINLDDTALQTSKKAPLIRKALKMLVAYNAGGQQMEVLESAIDFDLISSFSASSYSETRRELNKQLTGLHPWPALNYLLNAIVYFDDGGVPVRDGPAIEVLGVEPKPGSDIMDVPPALADKFRSPYTLPLPGSRTSVSGAPWISGPS